MTRLMALIAFAVLTVFLVILVVFVPSPDLILVVALTIGLVAYDFVTSSG